MGLLDEAIREHLELKRRRGADPGDLARAERAVLEPAPPAAAAEGVEEQGDADAEPPLRDPAGAIAGGGDEHVAVAQETAELDMRTVLDDPDPPHGDPLLDDATRVEHAAGAPRAAARSLDEDALAWEMPGEAERREPPPEPIPGQERLSFE